MGNFASEMSALCLLQQVAEKVRKRKINAKSTQSAIGSKRGVFGNTLPNSRTPNRTITRNTLPINRLGRTESQIVRM